MADCRTKKRNGLQGCATTKIPQNENYDNYKRQRNKVNNLIQRAKYYYNKNLLDENTKNATSFWRTLKSIFPTKPKSKLTSTTFKVNEKKYRIKKPSPMDLVNFSPL